MIEITDAELYHELCSEYGQSLAADLGYRLWLTSSFYDGFKTWVKEKYNITNTGNIVLTFENGRDYLLFILKRPQ